MGRGSRGGRPPRPTVARGQQGGDPRPLGVGQHHRGRRGAGGGGVRAHRRRGGGRRDGGGRARARRAAVAAAGAGLVGAAPARPGQAEAALRGGRGQEAQEPPHLRGGQGQEGGAGRPPLAPGGARRRGG